MTAQNAASAQRRKQATVVVISGPSGSGKTSICRELEKAPGYRRSISATTRPARPGERDGVDYHFITRDDFTARAKRGLFLEHADYLGHLYGTPVDQADEAARNNDVLILEIDVQGAEQVMRKLPQALCIFILPPSDAEIERRLRGRRTDDEAAIRARLARARDEVARCKAYQHTVINDDLHQAVARVRALIEPKRQGEHA